MSDSEQAQDGAAAAAVVSFRKALGMTQLRFAVEIVRSSVTTVARWETANPAPGIDALLKLANLAAEHHQPLWADHFAKLALSQVMPKLLSIAISRIDEGSSSGYVLCRFGSAAEAAHQAKFLRQSARELEKLEGKSPKAK